MDANKLHSIRITDEAKHSLDQLAAALRLSKVDAASIAIIAAWVKYQNDKEEMEEVARLFKGG
jgi:predicted transcriptional regulator